MKKPKEKGVKITLQYEVEVRDCNGKLISRECGNAHSWVRNWIQILCSLLHNTANESDSVSLKTTAGEDQLFYGSAGLPAGFSNLCPTSMKCPADGHSYGIQVGNSNAAYSRTQYSLQGKITTGSGAGQLNYDWVTFEGYVETDNTAYFKILRQFHNGSGAAVTVREIGMVVANHFTGCGNYCFLICRDVLSTPKDVLDGQTLTVRYTLTISYA